MNRTGRMLVALMLGLSAGADAGALHTSLLSPQYVPPAELAALLGAREASGLSMIVWMQDGAEHRVEVRLQETANRILLLGDEEDLRQIEALARTCDVAPRQIALEARIIEVDLDKVRDLGVDWSVLSSQAQASWTRQGDNNRDAIDRGEPQPNRLKQLVSRVSVGSRLTGAANLTDALKLLEENGAATYRDTPRILTLNNRPATIFDGQRVTYVMRAND